MSTQFPVHMFSVLVCGRHARLMRWDRAGAIVTNSFDYVDKPDFLAKFFWNYARPFSEWTRLRCDCLRCF